jgi:ubiquinone/menaquinone biosynthesis C-methylase UbiE
MKPKPEDIILDMNEYYSARAPEHDALMGYRSNQAMEELLARIIKLVEPCIKGRNVLEIACGTGNWTQVLSKRAECVIAIDVNKSVIDIARDKTYENNNVEFRIADAYTLDGITGEFNAGFAADWLSHCPRSMIPRFLKALHSKLLPGSNVVFLDIMNCEAFEKETVYYDDDNNRVSIRTTRDGKEFHVIKNFPTEDELRGYLKGAGRDVEYHEDLFLNRWILKYVYSR